MRLKVALLLLGASLWMAAATKLTVEQLVSLVRSEIQKKDPDKEVAAYLATVSLSERLDDRTIEELRALGAGPRTVEALKTLRTASQTLRAPSQPTPTPPPPPPPPPLEPPSAEEQGKVIEQARGYAMNYTKSLPDFLCTQVTRRYVDPHSAQIWGLEDTLTAHVSYVDHKEDYKLMTRDGKSVTNSSIWSVGGANSAGEFGSMMAEIFDPNTEASFRWERWATLRGRRAHVYSYQVSQPRSQWHVTYGHDSGGGSKAETVPAYHGLIFVDRDLLAVVRITLVAELPSDFPMQQVEDTLDYDLAAISGHEYLLPLRAVVLMREGTHRSKNEVEFRLYRKFTAEATLKFDEPDAPPDDKSKKEPPK
jgi:hypothetical protein